VIDFNDSVYSNLDSKMKVIDMIDELNINQKVGVIRINITRENRVNHKLIMRMVSNY